MRKQGHPRAHTRTSRTIRSKADRCSGICWCSPCSARRTSSPSRSSALAVTALVAVLWRFGTHLGLDAVGHGAFTVLVATCVPLLMFAAFVYPNAVAFSLSTSPAGGRGGGRSVPYEEGLDQRLTIVAGFLICGIGIVFKSTYQIVILAAIPRRSLRGMAQSPFLAADCRHRVHSGGAFVISKLPVSLVQH